MSGFLEYEVPFVVSSTVGSVWLLRAWTLIGHRDYG